MIIPVLLGIGLVAGLVYLVKGGSSQDAPKNNVAMPVAKLEELARRLMVIYGPSKPPLSAADYTSTSALASQLGLLKTAQAVLKKQPLPADERWPGSTGSVRTHIALRLAPAK